MIFAGFDILVYVVIFDYSCSNHFHFVHFPFPWVSSIHPKKNLVVYVLGFSCGVSAVGTD